VTRDGRKRRQEKPAPLAVAAPRRRWWPLAVIACAAILVYSNSLSGPFIFDDRGTIIDNPTIERLSSREVLAAPHETPTAGRPVVNVSFALNYASAGRDVTGYHAVNIAIHLLCGLLVYGLARRAQPSANAALAIGLIWTVHPLNTEAVDYVTQRTESLMALFYLLTLYCAVRAFQQPRIRSRWEAASIAACVLGMASKESMVTAPLALVLYDRIFLFGSLREAIRERARLYSGLALTWLVLGGLMWTAPRNLSAGLSAHDADSWTYLMNQAVMITRYLWLSVWPRDLVLYYGWPLPLAPHDILPQALLLAALLGLTIYALWRHPRAGFLCAWFFLALAPTSSFMPIATEAGAERRMYLPLIPLIALAVIALRRAVQSPRLRMAALTVVTLSLCAGTLARNIDYQSSLRLAETTFERWPTPAAHSMLGTELAAAGRLPEAERHLREAAAVHPPARYYLGTVLSAEGRHPEAIDQLRSFIDSQPATLDQVHLARALLADSLMKDGRAGEAASQYRVMLTTHPDDVQAMVMLGQIDLREQRFGEAVELFRKVLDGRPADASTLGSLGIALASSGRLDEAIEVFRQAAELDPQNAGAQRNLARALALRER